MSTRALITCGGWDGHEPDKVAELCRTLLEGEGASVEVHDTLGCFDDGERLQGFDLIVPIWTMSTIDKAQSQNVSEAVARGTGIAGCHGGMCDAFRNDVLWQFMTGANWVAHPGGDGVKYRVSICDIAHDLTAGIGDFDVVSEQYYLHVDPVVRVLADTEFPTVNWYHGPNGPTRMPVVFTKRWGLGRVYYNALGHHVDVIDHGPARELMRRGLIWAAGARAAAEAAGERYEDYANPGKHL